MVEGGREGGGRSRLCSLGKEDRDQLQIAQETNGSGGRGLVARLLCLIR